MRRRARRRATRGRRRGSRRDRRRDRHRHGRGTKYRRGISARVRTAFRPRAAFHRAADDEQRSRIVDWHRAWVARSQPYVFDRVLVIGSGHRRSSTTNCTWRGAGDDCRRHRSAAHVRQPHGVGGVENAGAGRRFESSSFVQAIRSRSYRTGSGRRCRHPRAGERRTRAAARSARSRRGRRLWSGD